MLCLFPLCRTYLIGVGSFDSGKKFMSHTVTKNRTHDVADLDFGASCQWFLFIVAGIADQSVQPVLNRYRLDVARAVTTPARNYPLAQVAFVPVLGRIRLLIVVVHPHLSLAVV